MERCLPRRPGVESGSRPASFAATTADCRHVLAILADRDTALAARGASFARVEFVRRALLVRGTTALARNFALLAAVH